MLAEFAESLGDPGVDFLELTKIAPTHAVFRLGYAGECCLFKLFV